jgi:hypothetical protein
MSGRVLRHRVVASPENSRYHQGQLGKYGRLALIIGHGNGFYTPAELS